MFDKPQDIVFIFAIFGLIVITVGFGITSINDYRNETIDTTYFTNVQTGLTSNDYLQGTSNDMSENIGGQSGSASEPTQESYILQGIKGLFSLGKTINAVKDAAIEGADEIGLDPIYATVIISVIIIVMGFLIYSWLAGA